ncbi:Membrane associated protein with extracellular Ig-like domain, a component of a putative secretion system [Halapricum desulfuricans]|uniref:Membrane associated protein with extracellular Ig-like domain, a component of a putative secretion system n=2 Tax=Halapricum desulfuricans TaxID=2841257 RepID=A0A897N4B1_9EURY|nr:Membrane associated protein with extracellular Ig-like domain, a component of a putative secretion system [Halapricum desulfuricans]
MEIMRNALQEIRRIHITIPVDLVGVVVLVALFDGLTFRLSTVFPLARAVVGIVIALFVPGYLLLAIIFPRQSTESDQDDPVLSGRTQFGLRRLAQGGAPSWTERFLLSFGLSLALLPVLALVVAPISGSLSQSAVVTGLNAVVLFGVVTAFVRRNLVPRDERLHLSFGAWIASVREAFEGARVTDRVLTVLFVLSVVSAVATMGFVVLSPDNGEAYTSFAVLSENGDGELLASGYPEEIRQGTDAELAVRVENHEGSETDYTAVAVLQRIDVSDDSVTVTESEQVFRERSTVPTGETWTATHTVEPTLVGENLRLRYYLYQGEPPQNVNADTAYRTVSLWTSVSPSE